MKNIKAFTLVELLVVISIIALLLALLIPSLGMARELAYRISCGANLKTIATASNTYSSLSEGYFVPGSYIPEDLPEQMWWDPTTAEYNTGKRYWFQNETFRKYIKIDSYQVSDNLACMPKEFLCPADKWSKQQQEGNDRMSYGFNNSDWRPWTITYRIVGYKASTVRKPAETINFVDSISWWADYNGAHYLGVWDDVKNIPNPDNWDLEQRWGPVMYRHSEGALAGFYDGHASWYHKTVMLDMDEYYAEPVDTGMWTATRRMIEGWQRRY